MKTTTDRFAADILNQVQNSVQETLLLHAPKEWSDRDLDKIEEKVLDTTRQALNADKRPGPDPAQHYIEVAVHQAKRLIEETKHSRDKWLYPGDQDLTTIQVTLPSAVLAELDAAVAQHNLKDQEHFISLATKYALQILREEALVDDPAFPPVRIWRSLPQKSLGVRAKNGRDAADIAEERLGSLKTEQCEAVSFETHDIKESLIINIWTGRDRQHHCWTREEVEARTPDTLVSSLSN